MKKLPIWFKNTIYSLSFILIVLGMFLSVRTYYKAYENENNNRYLVIANDLSYDATDHLYLSDIDYVSLMSYVKDGYYFKKDKNNLNGLIEVNVKDEAGNKTKQTFIKGISAWATSNIVYDVADLPYDYFTAYVGVDANQTSDYYNSGVRFTIFTSMDGETWENVYTSELKKGWDAADFVKISLYEKNPEDEEAKGNKVKYIRLYAHENGNSWYSHWHDDAVYANAKLIKEGYVEETKVFDDIKKVEDYDQELQNLANPNDFNNLASYQNTLLEREFVSRVGYDILQALFNYSPEYENIINTLFNDEDLLELYLLGGKPDGNYVESLKLLEKLITTYQDDFNDPKDGELYKKMAVTLSLTHSANVGLWVSGAPEDPDDPNGSNALERYLIFKKLYKANKLENAIFTKLSVEEMRYVMNNIIDDEEIIWLNDYTRLNNSSNPYTYINYTFDYNYTLDKYYEESREAEWNNKVHGKLAYAYHFSDGEYFTDKENFTRSDYNITYKKGYPKLWIVFEEGSVCGGLSKTGSNIQGSYGIPSSVVSQPGHAAYIYMALSKDGEKYWTLYNDVSGWGQSGKTEKLSVRMPNGWGDGDYVGNYPATYVLLAQSALNDYEHYGESEKILMLANVYSDNLEKEKIYEAALEEQKINFDAWLGLVNVYDAKDVSDADYFELAKRIAETLRNYPLPMDDLLKLIQKNMKTNYYKTEMTNLIDRTLKDIKDNPDKDYVSYNAAVQVATYLLQSHEVMATFSFDGDDAGLIKLNDKIITDGAKWEYSVDSRNWSSAEGLSHELTETEINTIHPETEILIRIIGENSEKSVYEIPIENAILPPEISFSDKENKINLDVEKDSNRKLGYSKDAVEWKLSSADDSSWTKIKDNEPDLSGNKNIDIRVGRHGSFLESEKLTLEFTAIGESDDYLYVDNKKLKVDSFSSEETGREDNAAENVLDDKLDTIWHTNWDGSDQERYIVLKLSEPTLISALEYVPRQASNNGIVTVAEVYVSMNGTDWTLVEAQNSLNWEANRNSKYAIFKEPVEALYVKLHGKEVAGDGRSFMSAASISLFENASAKTMPTAEVEYSETEPTTNSVVAKLVNANKHITITNPKDGSDSYVFTKNGSFTFEFVDDYGNTGKVTATVTWIKEEENKPSDPGIQEGPGIEDGPSIEEPPVDNPSEPEVNEPQEDNKEPDTNTNDSVNNNSNSNSNNSSNNNNSSTPNNNNNTTNNNSNNNSNNSNNSSNNNTNNNQDVTENKPSDDDNYDMVFDPSDGIINKGTTEAKKFYEQRENALDNLEEVNPWTTPKMIALYVIGSLIVSTAIVTILYNKGIFKSKKYYYED